MERVFGTGGMPAIEFSLGGAAKALFHYDERSKRAFIFEYESDLIALKAVYDSVLPFSPKISLAYPDPHRHRMLRELVFDFGSGKKIVATLIHNAKDPHLASLERLAIGDALFEKPTLGEIQGDLVSFLAGMMRVRRTQKAQAGECANGTEKEPGERGGIFPLSQNKGEFPLPRGKWVPLEKLQNQDAVLPLNRISGRSRQKITMR